MSQDRSLWTVMTDLVKGAKPMSHMNGVITIVQEGRFQLTDDNGISHQFVLGHGALCETEQLRPLQTRQARVRVKYTDTQGLISMTAKRIDLFDTPAITPPPTPPLPPITSA
ncbi:MAG: hypothetical protein ACYDD1_22545 [Caulobacteraceae bacterium]